MNPRIVLWLSIPLILFIVISSCVGLLTTDFYRHETPNWQAQSIGQDLIDLAFIAPCLLVSTVLVARKRWYSAYIWGGTVLYLTYTFFLYAFDVHFNVLFVVYCVCLGLSFYSTAYFLVKQSPQRVNQKITPIITWYFIVVAGLFHYL